MRIIGIAIKGSICPNLDPELSTRSTKAVGLLYLQPICLSLTATSSIHISPAAPACQRCHPRLSDVTPLIPGGLISGR
jgi:hypothetical protein